MSKLTMKDQRFSRVKCTTQFIVGASDETDSEIIKSMFGIYRRLKFQRVYFSAYQKGLGHPDIPGEKRLLSNPAQFFMREHRLYQTDFLIRRYGFENEDIVFDKSGNLSLDKDPKQIWADTHPEFYPVKINSADKEALLRVPGLGLDSVSRILQARREKKIFRVEDLGITGRRLEKIRQYAVCG